MKTIKNKSILGLIILTILIGAGCKKEGCTDSNADNYDSKADKSNSSCVYRYPSAVKINSIPEFNPSGGTWDIDGNPDVYMRFTKSTANNWIYTTAIENDFSNTVTFTITDAPDYFTKEEWKYEILDFDLLSGDELISSGTFNPLSSGSNGKFTVVNGNTNIEFQYAVKE
ncbi:hypothetical protein BH11BAC2_BH11BAC2_18870 [soil metagenome]